MTRGYETPILLLEFAGSEEDLAFLAGEAGARDAGKMRLEGKEYIVSEGDVLHFRFNT